MGQGWFAYNTTVDWTRDILDVIAKETAEIGRPAELGPLELTIIPDIGGGNAIASLTRLLLA